MRRNANTWVSSSVASHCWLQGTDTYKVYLLMTLHMTLERFRVMGPQSTEQQNLKSNPGLLTPRPGPLPSGSSWSHHLLHQTSSSNTPPFFHILSLSGPERPTYSQQPPGPCPRIPRGRQKGKKRHCYDLKLLEQNLFLFEGRNHRLGSQFRKEKINPWVWFGIQAN